MKKIIIAFSFAALLFGGIVSFSDDTPYLYSASGDLPHRH